MVRMPAGLQACAAGVLILAVASCHVASKPAAAPALPAGRTADSRASGRAVARPPSSAAALQRHIDAILAEPALEHSYWGILIRSLARDETLYDRNARKLLLP